MPTGLLKDYLICIHRFCKSIKKKSLIFVFIKINKLPIWFLKYSYYKSTGFKPFNSQ